MRGYHPKKLLLLIGIVSFLVIMHGLFSLTVIQHSASLNRLPGINSFEELQQSKAFSFSIFSDNQGYSPASNLYMARMNMHIRKTNDLFVLGVGDHVSRASANEFLFYVCNDPFWKNNFYPTIADGENSLFGKSQEDWGSGRGMFESIDLNRKNNVVFSNEKVDYYSLIEHESGYTVHFISLYFPDEPSNIDAAFRPSSKLFLQNTLSQIQKSKFDIIVIAAHSRFGFFTEYLSPELKQMVLQKADIVVSGSTHYYERQISKNMDIGPLILNSGSVTNPRFGSKPGFIQVSVLPDQQGIHVQFIPLDQQTFQLNSKPYAFFKTFNGRVYELEYFMQAL